MQQFRPINQQNNYFSSMIKRFDGNVDFVSLITPEMIQKSAKERIFREMSKGQIKYEEYGNYFLDPKFLDNLIVAANDELNNNATVCKALEYFDLTFPGDQSVYINRVRYSCLLNIYSIIFQRLSMVKATGNIGSLTDIQYVLKPEQTQYM